MMKRVLVASCLAGLVSMPAVARDTEYKLPLADVLAMPEAKAKLDDSFGFHLSGAKAPKIVERLGEGVSNRKTNGVGKDDEVACRWAALSALIALQDSAKQKGANAVVDIVSYYKKKTFVSATDYECHAGAMIVGVTLKGVYAKVGD